MRSGEYVQDRLAGAVTKLMGRDSAGRAYAGSVVVTDDARTGAGRCRGVPSKSPTGSNSISPMIQSMRISHEAIYQALFVQGRGALRRELTACLRTGRALRVPRARTRGRGKGFITDEVLIRERPAEADDRAVPGHWEGDLILGLDSSAIGTLVERTTRFTMLLHLPRMDGARRAQDSRTARRSPAMALRRSGTRSPPPSPPCPSSCDDP